MEIILLCAVMILELWVLSLQLRGGAKNDVTPEEEPPDKAKELEKRWNDGVSGILSYDVQKAKGAARQNEEE